MQQTGPSSEPITVARIEDQLRKLSPDKLATVFDFVSYLVERQGISESFQTMLASEQVLRRDWDTAEEDAAWADL